MPPHRPEQKREFKTNWKPRVAFREGEKCQKFPVSTGKKFLDIFSVLFEGIGRTTIVVGLSRKRNSDEVISRAPTFKKDLQLRELSMEENMTQ